MAGCGGKLTCASVDSPLRDPHVGHQALCHRAERRLVDRGIVMVLVRSIHARFYATLAGASHRPLRVAKQRPADEIALSRLTPHDLHCTVKSNLSECSPRGAMFRSSACRTGS